MSFIKYIISVDEITIALKYNLESKELVIGGFAKFNDFIETVISEYFKLEVPTANFVQSNKLRYSLQCDQKLFSDGKKLLMEHGIHITVTTSLHSIMR